MSSPDIIQHSYGTRGATKTAVTQQECTQESLNLEGKQPPQKRRKRSESSVPSRRVVILEGFDETESVESSTADATAPAVSGRKPGAVAWTTDERELLVQAMEQVCKVYIACLLHSTRYSAFSMCSPSEF